MDLVSKLNEVSLLQKLSPEQLSSLAKLLTVRNCEAGEEIISATSNETSPGLYFVLSGRLKANLFSSQGKEIVVANFSKGDFFGELALLTGGKRSANIVSLVACEIIFLSKDNFYYLIRNSPEFSLSLLTSLASRLSEATEKIGDLALYDVYRRVARTLQALAIPNKDEQGNQRLIISKRPTHHELAAIVGTSREMVTRAFKGLEEDGCILVKGKEIEFLKLPRG